MYCLTILTKLFDKVCQNINTLKTEAAIFLPGRIRTYLSKEAYCAMIDSAARAPREEHLPRCKLCQ